MSTCAWITNSNGILGPFCDDVVISYSSSSQSACLGLTLATREIIDFRRHSKDISTIRLLGRFHLYLPEYHLQVVYMTEAMGEARWEAIPTQTKLTVLLVFISSDFVIIKYLIESGSKSYPWQETFGGFAKYIYTLTVNAYHISEMIINRNPVLR